MIVVYATYRACGAKADFSVESILKEYGPYGRKLKRSMGDVSALVSRKFTTHRFLFEQAHGTMLDPVFGTYPFTVAPPTIASAVFPMVGIPAVPVNVLGVVKAYTTRVGNGLFPTELTGLLADRIRDQGHEYGTVSKRPRRVGWLDLPLLRYAVRINGVGGIAVTKLDVLSGISTIKVCTGYRLGRSVIDEFPSEISLLPRCRPVYTTLRGWTEDINRYRRERQLPKAAREYLGFLATSLGVPVRLVSVGAERTAVIKP